MSFIDVSKDPYGRKYYAAEKRRAFEKLKRTNEFKKWKSRQLNIQKRKCAYCHIPLWKRNIIVHIDHINPLFYEGTNEYENLVLTCRRCNVRKWVNNRIVKPEWIVRNEKDYPQVQQLSTIRGQQKKLMQEMVEKELDEQIGYQLRQKLR